jgi:FkbM family methyltransferase
MNHRLRKALKRLYTFIFKPFFKNGVIFNMEGAGRYRFDYVFALGEYRNFGKRHNSGFRKWLEICKGKETVFDIGAHIGLYSIPASSRLKRGGDIYAFEPSAANRAYLEKHIDYNRVGNIRIVPDLVGERSCDDADFYEGRGTSPMNSIIKSNKTENHSRISKRQVSVDEFCRNNGVSPQVIKIDVEGAELNVLKGAGMTLEKSKPVVFLSIHPGRLGLLGQSVEDLRGFIKRAGYKIYDTDGAEADSFLHNEYILSPEEAPEELFRAEKAQYLRRFNRFASFYYQFYHVSRLARGSVLEVGSGYGFLAALLRQAGYETTTVDFKKHHNPDITGDFKEIEMHERYDVVCSFEMLEHMPYTEALGLLNKMASLAKDYVIVSMPYHCWGAAFRFYLKLPKIKLDIKFGGFPNIFRRGDVRLREIDDKKPYDSVNAHYWEVGRKSYPVKRVINDINKNDLKVVKWFSPLETPHHIFFICEKRGADR